MTKKNMKIIQKILKSTNEKCQKIYFDNETGYYYGTDGYRMVRIDSREMNGAEIPMFDESEEHYNCATMVKNVADKNYTELFIPYTVEQIKEWNKNEKKNKRRTPFTLGVKCHTTLGSSFWIGINPTFLIDAIETTGSNYIQIPDTGCTMLMEGKGYLWLIMPIQCEEWEHNKKMTEIEI